MMKHKLILLMLLNIFGSSSILKAHVNKDQNLGVKAKTHFTIRCERLGGLSPIEPTTFLMGASAINKVHNEKKETDFSRLSGLGKYADTLIKVSRFDMWPNSKRLVIHEGIDHYESSILNLNRVWQKSDEITIVVKLVSALCGDWCYYDFMDIKNGKSINLSWDDNWDEKNGSTFPGVDKESARLLKLITDCANHTESACPKVESKIFIVKAIKKKRPEWVPVDGESQRKTGRIETYYKVKNIRYR